MVRRLRLHPSALFLVAAGLVAGLIAGCGDASEPPADYRQQVEAWQARRLASLQQPTGWLSLVGLYWLDEGDNTFGSARGNDLVFPEKAPPRMGVLRLTDGTVVAHAAEGVELRVEGRAVDSVALYPTPAEGEPSATLHWGSLSWYVIERDGRRGVRLKDSESAALTAFEGVDAYPIDPAWRVVGRFEPYEPPRTLAIPTILGTESSQASPGAVVFEVDGQTLRLDVTGEPGAEQYFVIFGDETNGRETYGAGRYLYVDAPEEDGTVVVDFNKAYNPPCVFTAYATCPFPPPQNKLPVAVTAGELTYAAGAP